MITQSLALNWNSQKAMDSTLTRDARRIQITFMIGIYDITISDDIESDAFEAITKENNFPRFIVGQ